MKKLWKCGFCGFTHEGADAPDFCPKCGSPKEKYAELSTEDAEKIYKSERTNDIHMELITLSSRIVALCKEGILINLDAPCISTFVKAKDDAWVIKQRAKAELESHMKKGKW
jgi:hypothetical protein